jgi:hypothetical protein
VSILTQFIFRLSFGLALGMALTDPRKVTSGYYRNHLYVLLGLNVLAAMVAATSDHQFALAPPIIAAVISYVGSVMWLYEKPKAGIPALAILSGVSLWGAWSATDWSRAADSLQIVLIAVDPVTGGLLLGLTMAAMFLGHWYLNTPTMAIGPLERLVVLMGGAIVLRALTEGVTTAVYLSAGLPSTAQLLFIALRWLSGLLGAMLLVVMTHKTLKIPNTQSATGILYVCVIATYLGELTALLMNLPAARPL